MPYKNFEELLHARLTGEEWEMLYSKYGKKNTVTYRIRRPENNFDHGELLMFADMLGISAFELYSQYGVARKNLNTYQVKDLQAA
jgi:hypothetical protein